MSRVGISLGDALAEAVRDRRRMAAERSREYQAIAEAIEATETGELPALLRAGGENDR